MAVSAPLRVETGRIARLRAERAAALAADSGVDSVSDMLIEGLGSLRDKWVSIYGS